jgi:alkylation response protein AidB-like acyl-CoA dehydrogenase
MSTTLPDPTTTDRERELVAWAAELGREVAEHAERHDRDGTFVTEAYELLADRGYLALAVPTELGGHGATIREVAMAQRELARHCSATALASTMHQHVVLFTAWRYRRDLAGAEATLRRVADEAIVLVSTGGGDLTDPRGTATRVEGGFVVNGRKPFASQAPVGAAMSTMFTYDDPDEGRLVLNMAIPTSAEGVSVLPTWDALGMRGTGSHDIELKDVFVSDAQVLARRPHGRIDPPLQVIMSIAMPPIAAVYLGIAEAARDHAVQAVAGSAKADDPVRQRQVGLMDHRLRVAAWALEGALATVGDDPTPSMDTVVEVMAAKREIVLAGTEVAGLAMELTGGAAFRRGNPVERCLRDLQAARYHPLDPEETLVHAGRAALGLPTDER